MRNPFRPKPDPAKALLLVWTQKSLPKLTAEVNGWTNEAERATLKGMLDRVNSQIVADVVESTFAEPAEVDKGQRFVKKV